MTKQIKIAILTFLGISILFFGGCVSLLGSFEDPVITLEQNVKPEYNGPVMDLPVESIPLEYRVTWKDAKLVLVEKYGLLSPDVEYVPASITTGDWEEDNVRTLVFSALTAGQTFFPWLIGIEGLLGLLWPRKRKNYITALKAFIPTDGKVDILAGIKAVGAALGMAHTSEASKLAVEQESNSVIKSDDKVTTKVNTKLGNKKK